MRSLTLEGMKPPTEGAGGWREREDGRPTGNETEGEGVGGEEEREEKEADTWGHNE